MSSGFSPGVALAALLSLTSAAVAAGPCAVAVRPSDSLEAVRDRVRALSQTARSQGVEVVLAPGEWWLDRAKKTLYVCPPREGLAAKGGVELVANAQPLLRGKGVRNLRFEGLEFSRNYVGAVDFRNADSVTFLGCRRDLVRPSGKAPSIAKALPRLEMSNNVVLVSSPGKPVAKSDRRLPAAAFVTMTNAIDEVFVDASRGDFRLKPDSPVARRIATLARHLEKVPSGKAVRMSRAVALFG